MENIGSRLRAVREARGLGLREAARQLDVSASFLSQLETGKSQPSVSTLYSLTRLLDVSIDQLFDDEATATTVAAITAGAASTAGSQAAGGAGSAARALAAAPKQTASARATSETGRVNRSSVGGPVDVWATSAVPARFEIARPGERRRIDMDSGVVWEQLVTNTAPDMELLEVVYAPHSSSTTDGRMLRHEGYEFGLVLEGELEITYGFDSHVVRAGDSFGFDSGVPHLFRNTTDEPVRFVSCNRRFTV
jgi:transcriptional regulator with XRE-family HTH domain/quercetin dioxygenase-like cupin family protein